MSDTHFELHKAALRTLSEAGVMVATDDRGTWQLDVLPRFVPDMPEWAMAYATTYGTNDPAYKRDLQFGNVRLLGAWPSSEGQARDGQVWVRVHVDRIRVTDADGVEHPLCDSTPTGLAEQMKADAQASTRASRRAPGGISPRGLGDLTGDSAALGTWADEEITADDEVALLHTALAQVQLELAEAREGQELNWKSREAWRETAEEAQATVKRDDKAREMWALDAQDARDMRSLRANIRSDCADFKERPGDSFNISLMQYIGRLQYAAEQAKPRVEQLARETPDSLRTAMAQGSDYLCTCDPLPDGWPYTHYHNCPRVALKKD